MTCPCGSRLAYEACCGQYHAGALPPTAEALMRTRYSAFAKGEIEYLKETSWPANQKQIDEAAYRERSANSIWIGLTIHECQDGLEADMKGTVNFTAKSMVGGQIQEQSENSLFKKKNGRWFYVMAIG